MDAPSPKQQLGSSEGLAWVRSRIGEAPELSRYRLAREVCERLNWRDERGCLKEMACRKHLLHLERRGEIVLPPVRRLKPQRCRERVPPAGAPEFSGMLAGLGPIELQPVRGGTAASRSWNALMEAHHPLGSGPLCGAQIRYLIVSQAQGVVGGVAVSAPAWRLGARDEWLGWSDAERGKNLSGIVCNSRFVILPTIKVMHLGSYVLGALARRIAADWQERYAISPWLMETYVEATRSGTVYRAANWIEVGMTAGRGRQDRSHTADRPEKRVFLYPLCRSTLERLCGKRPLPEPGWVHREFGGAKLGDHRLLQRLFDLATAFFARPTADIPQACASLARTKAAYRFFDHERTTMKTLLEPHRNATIDRMRREPIVLAVQDSSSLNYTTHRDMQGIGPIGSTVDGPQGLILHSTLAFRPDGLPLGILDVECWERDPATFGKKHQRHNTPFEDKESYKWPRALTATREAADRCPNTRIVTLADREADIFEFFQEAQQQHLDLLVRAKENRALDEDAGKLWPYMQSLAQAGEVKLEVPRQGRRRARTARMSLRFAEMTFKPPAAKKHLSPIRMWTVWTKEIDAPADVEPLEWMLMTTVAVTDLEAALERVQWYARSWGIEVFHRILKSGCRIEDRQLGTADRLQACLAIDMVVAWRIHHLTCLGRTTPDVPCTVVFDQDQWKALVVFKTRKPPPDKPPTLAEMNRIVAQLGGFLGRKADGKPGTETLWRGLQRMDDIAATFSSTLAAYRAQPP